MTRRKCPSCDSFTDSLPEPEDRVIIDGVVECLIFADAEDMECHDRMERCSMCRPKLSPRALLRKHVRRPLRSNSAHSDDEDKKTVEHDDRKPAEEIPVSNVSSTTIPQAKRGRPRGSGKSLGNTKPKINNNNDNSENNFGSKTRRPHSKSLDPSSEVRVSPAKRRGRPPGSKNKVKPPPPPPPVKAATSATSNLVEADMPPIFVYGPVKDRRKQHTGASPIIELSPSRTEFAVSALNPQLMSSYSSSSPSSSLTPRVLSHGKMTRAGRRKFDEKTFAHLHCPKQYDPSFYHRHLDEEQQRQQTQHDEAAGSVSSSSSTSSLPPAACGNSFCQLGCVCEDWGRDVDEIYEQLCGRFECVHGCVCPSASASTSTTGGAGMVARPRRRRRWTDKFVGINARDAGPDLEEELRVKGQHGDPVSDGGDASSTSSSSVGGGGGAKGGSTTSGSGSGSSSSCSTSGSSSCDRSAKLIVGGRKTDSRVMLGKSKNNNEHPQPHIVKRSVGRPPKNGRNHKKREAAGDWQWCPPAAKKPGGTGEPRNPKTSPGLNKNNKRRVGRPPTKLSDFLVEVDPANAVAFAALPFAVPLGLSDDILVESYFEDEVEERIPTPPPLMRRSPDRQSSTCTSSSTSSSSSSSWVRMNGVPGLIRKDRCFPALGSHEFPRQVLEDNAESSTEKQMPMLEHRLMYGSESSSLTKTKTTAAMMMMMRMKQGAAVETPSDLRLGGSNSSPAVSDSKTAIQTCNGSLERSINMLKCSERLSNWDFEKTSPTSAIHEGLNKSVGKLRPTAPRFVRMSEDTSDEKTPLEPDSGVTSDASNNDDEDLFVDQSENSVPIVAVEEIEPMDAMEREIVSHFNALIEFFETKVCDSQR